MAGINEPRTIVGLHYFMAGKADAPEKPTNVEKSIQEEDEVSFRMSMIYNE